MIMKKLVVLMLLLDFSGGWAAVGCCSATINRCTHGVNSYAIHPVHCVCDCARLMDARGFCKKCGHVGQINRGRVQRKNSTNMGSNAAKAFAHLAGESQQYSSRQDDTMVGEILPES